MTLVVIQKNRNNKKKRFVRFLENIIPSQNLPVAWNCGAAVGSVTSRQQQSWRSGALVSRVAILQARFGDLGIPNCLKVCFKVLMVVCSVWKSRQYSAGRRRRGRELPSSWLLLNINLNSLNMQEASNKLYFYINFSASRNIFLPRLFFIFKYRTHSSEEGGGDLPRPSCFIMWSCNKHVTWSGINPASRGSCDWLQRNIDGFLRSQCCDFYFETK